MFSGDSGQKPNPFGGTSNVPVFGNQSSAPAPNVNPFAGNAPAPNVNPFAVGGSVGTGGFGSSTTSAAGMSTGPFGSSSFTQTGSAGFGSTGPAGNPFATQSQGTSGFGSSGSFGATTTQTSSGPFGVSMPQTSPSFGTATNAFGANAAPPATHPFGGPATQNSMGQFGAAVSQSSSLFGAGTQTNTTMFGAANTQATTNVFGAPVTASNAFGAPTTAGSLFGMGTQPTSLFGASTTSSGFGSGTATGSAGFGASNTTSSMFGAATTTAPNVFGAVTTTTPSVFGAVTTTAPSVFGAVTTTAPSVFGAVTTTAPSVFGASATSTAGVFGAVTTTAPSMFGASATTTAGVFGATTTTTANVFGAVTTTPSMFGATTTTASNVFGAVTTTAPSMFGAVTTTASNVFGAATTTAPSVFGGRQLSTGFGQSGFGTSTSTSSGFGATGSGFGNQTSTGQQGGLFAQRTTSSFTSGSGNTEARSSSVSSASRLQTTVSSFSSAASALAGSSKFGQQSNSASSRPQQPTAVFGGFNKPEKSSGTFGAKPDNKPSSVFGGSSKTETSLFGASKSDQSKPEAEKLPSHGSSSTSGSSQPPRSLFGKEDEGQQSGGHSSQISEAGKIRSSRVGDRKANLFGQAIAGVMKPQKERTGRGAESSPDRERRWQAQRSRSPSPSSRSTSPTPSRETEKQKERPSPEHESASEAAPTRRFSRQRSSPKDLHLHVAIVCKNIPHSSFNKTSLQRHFSKFGKVTRTSVNHSKGSAIIHFADHQSALNAKKYGRSIRHNSAPMNIFWSSYTKDKTSPQESRGERRRSDDRKQSESERDVHEPKSSSSRAKKLFGTTVEDELASMSGAYGIKAERTKFSFKNDDRVKDSKPPLKRSKDADRIKPKKDQFSKDLTQKERSRSPLPLRRNFVQRDLSPSKPTTSQASAPKVEAPKPAVKVTTEAPSSTSTSAVVTMWSLKQVIAHSANERYEALENRDKLIRQILDSRKPRDLATAKAIIGTCPDMCPEKERYVREDRRRLTLYEMVSGEMNSVGNPLVDHARAVKEYSRSSADQEMPLPDELRPPHVLDMTMNYMMNNILDLGNDECWEDWYEFLWSRTRGIRKDITQQQLCNLTVVGLVEKCTRFHIYCSQRLCEEEMAVFDQKINNENLTKCLQTLKEFYHDMKEHHNTECPNESEFRSYMVLMNLNQGDILWEIQQLQDHIRQHPDVVFVLKAHSTLNTNNYVRFFRLVKQAKFTHACLLHRYFDQVRRHAIRAMARCYTKRIIPAYKLMEILAFETEIQVRSFCSFHNLQINEKGNVVFKDFVNPDTNYPINRAIKLIESKQEGKTVGEVVNGGPLPPNVLHQPLSSFDEYGRFREAALSVSVGDQEEKPPLTFKLPAPEQALQTEQLTQVSARDEPAQPSLFQQPTVQPMFTPLTQQPDQQLQQPQQQVIPSPEKVRSTEVGFTNEMVKDVAKGLFIEVIEDHARSIASTMLTMLHLFIKVSNSLIMDMAMEVIQQETKAISEEVIQEERMSEMERRARLRAEQSACRERVASAIVEEVAMEVSSSQCQKIAVEEYQIVRKKLDEESRSRCTLKINAELCTLTVEEEIQHVIQEFYLEHVIQKREELEAFTKAVEVMRLGRYFRKWKNELAGRQRLKRSMLTFPPAPSMSSATEIMKRLIPGAQGISQDAMSLGNRAQLTLLPPTEAMKNRESMNVSLLAYRYLKELRQLKAWAPLDVVSAIQTPLMSQVKRTNRMKASHVYWKLLVAIPDTEDCDLDPDDLADLQVLQEWLAAKLRQGAVPVGLDTEQSQLWSLHSTGVDPWETQLLHVCIRAVWGTLSQPSVEEIEDRHLFVGATGMLFVISVPETTTDMETWLLAERLRLARLLQAKPSIPAVPLAVMVYHQGAARNITQLVTRHLQLAELVQDGHVSQYQVFQIRDHQEVDSSTRLSAALSWLSEHAPTAPKLQKETLVDYVDNLMAQEFYGPVYQNLAERRKKGLLDHPPDVLVNLYHTLICHLADTASDLDLAKLSWPLTEYAGKHQDLPEPGWNCGQQLDVISQTILSCDLPVFDIRLQRDCNWEVACQAVWEYVSSLQHASTIMSNKLHSRIAWLLRRCKSDFDDFCSLLANNPDVEPRVDSLPWTDIVPACIDHQMEALRDTLADKEGNRDEEMQVYYDATKLQRVPKDEGWRNALHVQQQDSPTLEMNVVKAVKRKHISTSHKRSTKAVRVDPPKKDKIPDIPSSTPEEAEARTTAHELSDSLVQEKQKMDKFEEFLQRALEEGKSRTASREQSPLLNITQTPVLPRLSLGNFASTPKCHPGTSPQKSLKFKKDVDTLRKIQSKTSHSLDDKLDNLRLALASQREADKLYEMRLRRSMITQPF